MSFGSGLDMESKSELYIKASQALAYVSYCCLAILAAGSTAHLICHRFDLI